MVNVAKEAELSSATVYLYFKRKEELYASLSLRVLQYLLIRMEHINKEDNSPPEKRLENLKNALLDTYNFDPLVFINMLMLQSSEAFQQFSYEIIMEIKVLAIKILQEIVETLKYSLNKKVLADHNPVVLSGILWSLFSGIILREEIKKVVYEKEEQINANFKMAFDIFFKRLKAPQSLCTKK